ncbi:MAG: hypothetical protein EPN82_02110 [Bacteroidetes bacterium]|nr:MAG: hypothetical protein EPN82_02110 [Bacteroidota bacterium]
MNYKILYIIFISFISVFNLKSADVHPQDSLGDHLWYIEIWGSGLGVSFNYEYNIINNIIYIDKINIRTGIGSTLFLLNYFDLPVMLNFLIGKKYCFEFGFGGLFDYVSQLEHKDFPYPSQVIKFISVFGYRYIGDSGSIFRTSFTPIIFPNGVIIPYIGISFGHYF